MYCAKNGDTIHDSYLEVISQRVTPDNITPNPVKIIKNHGITLAVVNPSGVEGHQKTSVYQGNILNPSSNWHEPGAPVPSGAFALFRANKDYIELVTDTLASRSIWYYMDDTRFIASSSQRAIIHLIKSFEMNPNALSWMLYSGKLGPDISWDSRVSIMRANSRLKLDVNKWKMKEVYETIPFDPQIQTKAEACTKLSSEVTTIFKNLNLDCSDWALPLSGGYDSRTILSMLKEQKKIKCVTWGVKQNLTKPGTDGFIALQLAKKMDLNWSYMETNLSEVPVGEVFTRFFVAGEGRVDHVSGYMDGFAIWKNMFESGIKGVIRGDEPFGNAFPLRSEFDARRFCQLFLASDYTNISPPEEFGLPEQKIPEWFDRKEGESLPTWRDRLYQEYRVPYGNAALNDLKTAYVEIANPFLTGNVVAFIRLLPDSLRTNKQIFRDVFGNVVPDIPYASKSATSAPNDVFRMKRVVEEFISELDTHRARSLLSSKLIDRILANMRSFDVSAADNRRSFYTRMKTLLPQWVKTFLRNSVAKQKMDFNVLAFRAYTVSCINRLLNEDAGVFTDEKKRRIR